MNQPGLFARAEGLAQVETSNAAFLRTMRSYAGMVSESSGSVSTDDLRRYAERLAIRPHHPNAWGAIFSTAEWEAVGRKRSEWPTNRGRWITIWRLR